MKVSYYGLTTTYKLTIFNDLQTDTLQWIIDWHPTMTYKLTIYNVLHHTMTSKMISYND